MKITSLFFSANRLALCRQFPSSVIVLSASSLMQRRGDAAFRFEQDSNFWYLCGINEPDWRIIIDCTTSKSWLISPIKNAVRELFEGTMSGDEVLAISGVDDVLPHKELKPLLSQLLKGGDTRLVTVLPSKRLGRNECVPNPAPQKLIRELRLHKADITDCSLELSRLRSIKQPVEITALRKAIGITIEGIQLALKGFSYTFEYEFEAELTRHFRRLGAKGHAYDPIVASGANACILHYHANQQKLKKEEWVLFDVGAELNHYCADITRSLPVGDFTDRQKMIYEANRRVHDHAVSLCKPGQLVKEYTKSVDEIMAQELAHLRLIEKPTSKERFTYFPHAISHGLGLDVHDSLGRPEVFQEGMVLTVEPGIYVKEEQFGVRLENDILITATGPENLSAALPDDIDGLLKLVGSSK